MATEAALVRQNRQQGIKLKQLLTLVVALAALALCHVVSGQDQETDEWSTNYVAARDMFDFFNSCEGMTYNVRTSGKASNDSALSESDIANAVESRLRAARIFRENAQGAKSSYFNVYVTLAGNAVSLHVGFEKPGFADPYSTHRLFQFPRGMETWSKSWLVQGGYRSGDVLAQLSKYLDEFIVNYLRVNSDETCEEYRVAEQEHRAKLEAERAAERAKRDARATRWNGWSAEQCESLEDPGDRASCTFDAFIQEVE